MVSYHPDVDGEVGPQSKLTIALTMKLANGEEVRALALVDTGAEVNLVRRGLVDEGLFRRSENPRRLVVANQSDMVGGLMEVECELQMKGSDVDTGESLVVACPIVCYDAVLRVDMILSYEWLGRMGLAVECQQHGLLLKREEGPVFIPGVVTKRKGNIRRVVVTEKILVVEDTPKEGGKRTQPPKEGGERKRASWW